MEFYVVNKRRFIIIGVILIIALGACLYFTNNKDRFNTDKITIHYDVPSPDEKFFEITDENVIKEITSICSNGTFKRVPRSELLEGLCTIFIDFNNGTVVGLYDDIDYGYIGKEIDIIGGGAVYLPKGLNAYINKLIEENR